MTKAIGKQHWAEAALFCGMLLSCVGGAATFTAQEAAWLRGIRDRAHYNGSLCFGRSSPSDSQWAVLLLAMA